MIVERCTPERLEDWVRMRKALWPDETLEQHRRYATSLLGRPDDAIVYLACEESGDSIAFAEATLRRDYVNGCGSSPVGFLEGIYVHPTHRKRGFARLLCQTLEEWARRMGCSEFASDVLLTNELGQLVHRALGFNETDRVVIYSKRL